MDAVPQPSGTVTLVFTDVQGSTRLLAELGQAGYLEALTKHREVVRRAFGRHGGYEVDTQGDSFFYAFQSGAGAVRAVEEATAGLEGGPIAIRVGVHTGEPGLDGSHYVGMDVHTAARIMATGHGGQVVLSQSVCELLDGSFVLVDLGEHRLKDLSRPRRLYQLGTGTFPPLKTLHRTNLPMPASAFVGRERELEELAALLTDGTRLLTLTGPGGTGKTRLALQAVATAADGFPDGIWWVPFASVRDPGLVLSSVALALGVPEQPGRDLEDTLVDVLSVGRTILLLDNLEHLLPGAADAVATLRDVGRATVVVTSRERLQLSGERVYAVAPLATAEAVELFLARTAALDLDGGDERAVAELCARLDNLPLAVELAAARAGLLAPAEILSRLGSRLDRLRGGRDADPRQQTLRATIAWSHDLLDEPERELFARLAIFTGGGTLEAVEDVCDADLDVLSSLLEKNLVRRTGGRVWMLETIREFALEQLGADPSAGELRDRLAGHYLAAAVVSDAELRGRGQVDALEWFVAELDNLRAAMEWLLERDPAAALRLAAAMWQFWFMRGHFQEGREMLAVALERAAHEPSEARASALIGAGWVAWEQGDRRESLAFFEDALAFARAAGSTRMEVHALGMLANGYTEQLGREEQIRLGREAVAAAAAYGDRWLLALATGNHAIEMYRLGEKARATELMESAHRLSCGLGDDYLAAVWANNLAWYALLAGDTVKARARLSESLAIARQVNSPRDIGGATVNLGWVELLEDDLGAASTCFEEGVTTAGRLGKRMLSAEALWGLAQVAAARGDADRAARVAGAADTIGGAAGFDPAASISFTRHLDDACATLGDDAWQKAWAEGAELELDEVLRLAHDR
jgi:predicted ATPase/class 3 adenylate cyclase